MTADEKAVLVTYEVTITALVRTMMDSYGLDEVQAVLSRARLHKGRLAALIDWRVGLDATAADYADKLVGP